MRLRRFENSSATPSRQPSTGLQAQYSPITSALTDTAGNAFAGNELNAGAGLECAVKL